MSLADYKITEEQIANKRISTLSIRATDPIESSGSGLSGTGLKSRIDALALLIIENGNAIVDILTEQGVDTLAADLQAAIDRITVNEGDIRVINDAIIAINAALDALEGRISTNESNISGLQSTIASLVSDVETAIENAEKATAAANETVSTVNGLITTVNEDIAENEALRDELEDYQNSLKEIRVVDDIVARDAIENLYEGLRVHCIDATADETVESGWAEYLCKSDGEGGFEWTKTSEKDSIDVVMDAKNVDYDNTSSGLTAENTQNAIDELNTKIDENANATLWQQLCNNPKYHRIPYNATEGDIISLPLDSADRSFDVYYGSIANKKSYTTGGTKGDFTSDVTGYIDIIITADSSANMPDLVIDGASNDSLFVGKPRYSNLKTAIPARAFYDTNIVDFDIPDSITSIGNWAFSETLLKQIFIPDSVVSLGTKCFSLCTSLTKVRLPSGLTAIPDTCFEHCFELYDIVIPETVTSIGSGAFSSGGRYKNISFSGRRSISMGTGAFNGVSAILNFYAYNPTEANNIITSFKNRGGQVIFPNNLEPAAKAASPTEDNIATLTADGDLKDSGKAFSTTAVADTVPVYGAGGVLKVADGSASGDAVNKGQLDLKAPLANPTFTGTVTVPTPSGNTDAANKLYVDSEIAGVSAGIIYDQVIATQNDFETLIASPTWLDAKSVALVGQFTLSTADNSGIKIPATVKIIHGFNSAKITVTNFLYNPSTAKGGLWYDTRPTTPDYSIRDLEVSCDGSNSIGFRYCTNLTNCTGTGTGTGALGMGYGFVYCTNLTNCTGTGTGPEGYGF